MSQELGTGLSRPPATSVFEIETSPDAKLSIPKFAGDETITVWGSTQRREDEEGSLVEPRSGRAD